MMEMAGNMVVCQGLDHVSLESIEGTDSGEGDTYTLLNPKVGLLKWRLPVVPG